MLLVHIQRERSYYKSVFKRASVQYNKSGWAIWWQPVQGGLPLCVPVTGVGKHTEQGRFKPRNSKR